MKLTLLLLFVTVLTGIAADSYSQSTKLTLKLENVRIEDLLSKIEDQSQFRFFYNEEINLDKKVSIDVSTETIANILEKVFSDKKIQYEIVGRQIILSNGVISNNNSTQQQKSISGKVTDSSGGSLPGVSVVVKGTTTGVITDMNGKYTLAKVPENATLQFSFVGMKSQEIAVGSKININVTLLEETVGIEEVVAVGYGTQKKANLTGAVSTVVAKTIQGRPVTNLGNALQGQVPGMNITRSSGQPGLENITIQIRGASSANGNVAPLLLVDGVTASIAVLQTLNPLDVESMSVLKDGAAASIYGSQAAGGVILVTTKKGNVGKPVFEFSSNVGIQHMLNRPGDGRTLEADVQYVLDAKGINGTNTLGTVTQANNSEWTEFDLQQIANNVPYVTSWPTSSGTVNAPYNTAAYYNKINQSDLVLKDNSVVTTNNLNVSGGNDKTNYLFSIGYLSQPGMLAVGPDHYKRTNLRMNVGTEFSKNFVFDAKVAYSRSYTLQPNMGAIGGTNLSGNSGLFDILNKRRMRYPVFIADGPNAGKLLGQSYTSNVYAYLKEGGYQNSTDNNFNGTFQLTIKDLVKGLKFRTIYGSELDFVNNSLYTRSFDMYGIDAIMYSNAATQAPLGNPINSFNKGQYNLVKQNFQFLTDYNYKLGENHDFTFLGGYQFEDSRYESFGAGATNLLNNNVPTLVGATGTITTNQAIQTFANQSIFGRFNYSYQSKYLIEATIRTDESSRLAPGFRRKTFPSASVGWNIYKEEFISTHLPFISQLKARVSWGQLGNSQTGIGYYDYIPSLTNGTANVVLGDPSVKTFYMYQATLPSSSLGWETIETFNYGLDFGFFQNKLTGSFDYYTKDNNNMIVATNLPATYGAGSSYVNNGKLQTKGWEAVLSYRGHVSDFNYNIGINVSDSKNKLVKYTVAQNAVGLGQRGLILGEPLNTIWGYATKPGFINNSEDLAAAPQVVGAANRNLGDIIYVDQNGDKKITQGANTLADHGDIIKLGENAQHYLFGVTGNASYKGFDFSFFIQGVGKRDMIANATFYGLMDSPSKMPSPYMYGNYWTPTHTNALFPRPYFNDPSDTPKNYLASDRWVLNGAYARLKNVQLGYTLPGNIVTKVHLDKVRFYFSGENLFLISKLGVYSSVLDPEGGTAAGAGLFGDYSMLGTVSFGVNITF